MKIESLPIGRREIRQNARKQQDEGNEIGGDAHYACQIPAYPRDREEPAANQRVCKSAERARSCGEKRGIHPAENKLWMCYKNGDLKKYSHGHGTKQQEGSDYRRLKPGGERLNSREKTFEHSV
jgi:hypothetical protein